MRAQIEASLERFRIHFDSWALQSELARLPGRAAADRDVRGGGLAVGADVDVRRRQGPAARPLGRRRAVYYAADVAYLVDKLDRGFDRAIYVLGADHHGTRGCKAAVARCSGRTPSASRCCSTSSST